jgi:GNAT superfamily N-acetyltransferase
VRFSDELERKRARDEVREVFSLTSASGKSWEGLKAEDFFSNWAGWYMDNVPEQTLLLRGPENKIIGYLVGCFDSTSAGELFKRIFYYKELARWYTDYPAHFHVNCHPDYQGVGYGKALVERFGSDAKTAGVGGLHVVTGSTARNRKFYEQLQFRERVQALIGGRSLVLLGKYL